MADTVKPEASTIDNSLSPPSEHTGNRWPSVPASSQPAELQPFAEEADLFCEQVWGPNGSVITWKLPNDAPIGPFPFTIASGAVSSPLYEYMKLLGKLSGLPIDAKEVAILAVGSKFQASYMLYAHRRVSRKFTALTNEQIESICTGQKPSGLTTQASAAYDATFHLVHNPGPLPESLYTSCVEAFGKDGMLTLVQYVAWYAWNAVVLNAMDAPLPPGEQ